MYGSWMRDSSPSDDMAERYWVTINRTDILLEYANKTAFRNNITTVEHKLPLPFRVTTPKPPPPRIKSFLVSSKLEPKFRN